MADRKLTMDLDVRTDKVQAASRAMKDLAADTEKVGRAAGGASRALGGGGPGGGSPASGATLGPLPRGVASESVRQQAFEQVLKDQQRYEVAAAKHAMYPHLYQAPKPLGSRGPNFIQQASEQLGLGSGVSRMLGGGGIGVAAVAGAAIAAVNHYTGLVSDHFNADNPELSAQMAPRRFGESIPLLGGLLKMSTGGQFDRRMAADNMRKDYEQFALAQHGRAIRFQQEDKNLAQQDRVGGYEGRAAGSADFARGVHDMTSDDFNDPYVGERMAARKAQSGLVGAQTTEQLHGEAIAKEQRERDAWARMKEAPGSLGAARQAEELKDRSARIERMTQKQQENHDATLEATRQRDLANLGVDKAQDQQDRSMGRTLFEATPGQRIAIQSAVEQFRTGGIESLSYHQRGLAAQALGREYDAAATGAGEKYVQGGYHTKDIADRESEIDSRSDRKMADEGKKFGERLASVYKQYADAAIEASIQEFKKGKKLERQQQMAQ